MGNQPASKEQQAAITAKGPHLVLAGPGTGKTFVIIKRVIHLIKNEQVSPLNIMVVTYTVKAANELKTRLSDECRQEGLDVNLNEMYIGTFHHICRRLLKEYSSYNDVAKCFMETDQFEELYLVYEHFDEFEKIEGFETVVPKFSMIGRADKEPKLYSKWKRVTQVSNIISRLAEELLDPKELVQFHTGIPQVCGRIWMKYQKICKEKRFIDFSSLQRETYHMLMNYPEVRKDIGRKISHVLIDEYQDTNYVQEQLIHLFCPHPEGIFAVGDDDQSIYRFRGATVENILRFQERNGENSSKTILKTNYRSHESIVNFCMRFLAYPEGFKWKQEDRIFRHLKGKMESGREKEEGVRVFKIEGHHFDWEEKVVDLVSCLKKEKVISDFNQVAIMLGSVKGKTAKSLEQNFKGRNIPVYAPRSGQFFGRKEVQQCLGTLLHLLPSLMAELGEIEEVKETEGILEYYFSAYAMSEAILRSPLHREAQDLISSYRNRLEKEKSLPCTFLEILYQLFALPPFSNYLKAGEKEESLQVRNLSKITFLVSKYSFFLQRKGDRGTVTENELRTFFVRYLRLWFEHGIFEYEDKEEYAPKGHVSFVNIHQSKGLEYPVVIVASLYEKPWGESSLLPKVIESASGRMMYEPMELTGKFDFYRKYYTAFSRAKNLLILAGANGERHRNPWFEKEMSFLPSIDFSLMGSWKPFDLIKPTSIKKRVAFTTGVARYNECPLKYLFGKVYEFSFERGMGIFFGQLVHQTIEDIHRLVLEGEAETISHQLVYTWMMNNYLTLSEKENTWLSKKDLDEAFSQIMNYVQFRKGNWKAISQAEYPLEIVCDTYIMTGTIDLLEEQDGKVTIMDFKTGKMPSPEKSVLLENYKKQMDVYAYLVEKKLHRKVEEAILFFTGEENGSYRFTVNKDHVEETIRYFDETVKKIMIKDFSRRAMDEHPETCAYCHFKNYCERQ